MSRLGEGTFHSALQCIRLAWAWGVRFSKLRYYKCRQCKAQRNLDQRMARLGTEIYSLYKQGETEFVKSLVVRQQLKIVEEAESQLFAVMDRMEAIEQAYREKTKESSKEEQ